MLLDCGITPHGSTDIRRFTGRELSALIREREARNREVTDGS